MTEMHNYIYNNIAALSKDPLDLDLLSFLAFVKPSSYLYFICQDFPCRRNRLTHPAPLLPT
nr:hypothetical protein Q903MT_gene6035 [Picea sitchensis]